MTTTTRPDPTETIPEPIPAVELDWFDGTETVRVNPRNQIRFDVHKDRAIEVLQLTKSAESQIQLLIEKLAGWVRANFEEHLSAAYLTLRDARFAFLAISRTAECNDDLEDALSDLDLAIANDPDLDHVRVNTLVLPPASEESLKSFFDRRFFLVFNGPRT